MSRQAKKLRRAQREFDQAAAREYVRWAALVSPLSSGLVSVPNPNSMPAVIRRGGRRV